jgi:hypothetical protein
VRILIELGNVDNYCTTFDTSEDLYDDIASLVKELNDSPKIIKRQPTALIIRIANQL